MKPLYLMCLLLASTLANAKGIYIDYTADGNTYEGYYSPVNPSPAKAPLVIILHDWDGLTDYELKRTSMLNKLGYNVFAVDLFGKGIRPTKMEDKRQHTGELYKNRTKMRAILNSALESAVKLGGDSSNTAVIGYCFGGAATLEFARSGAPLKAFVSIHGGLATPDGQDYSKTKGKVLVQHGAADANISMTDFANLAQLLEANNIDHEMIAYGGAPHAWTVFGGDRYREAADRKSWQRLIEFLEETLDK